LTYLKITIEEEITGKTLPPAIAKYISNKIMGYAKWKVLTKYVEKQVVARVYKELEEFFPSIKFTVAVQALEGYGD
jgi:N-glycosylase/DNA lyase